MDKLNIEAERREFEDWCKTAKHPEGGYRLERIASGEYVNAETRCAFRGWVAARRAAPSSSADELPDAVIAGIMGCRGPGVYTAATLRKIREVIAADHRARGVSVINYGSPVDNRAAIQAAAPADAPKLDADELARLRRLMRALGMDGSLNGSDEYVRGLLFTVLGRAAGKLERAPAEDAREQQQLTNFRIIELAYENGIKVRTGAGAIKFARAVETEVASRFRAQGGITSDNKDCRAAGSDRAQAGEDARSVVPEKIEITREGRMFWHTNCAANRFKSGVMRVVSDEPTRSLIHCQHCGKYGYYPVGGAGRVCSDEVAIHSPAAQKEGGADA